MQNESTDYSRKNLRPNLFLKGMAMGAADVVPGVSGGTIAFITGIYEELVNALNCVDLTALKMLFSGQVLAAWLHINGNFLAVLFAGILVSIFSMANLVSWLLDEHPIIVWAYFFGLILASVVMLAQKVDLRNLRYLIALLIGAGVAFEITQMTAVSINPTGWVITACGALAICAMILPGISGSFILLLLGMYEPVLNAVKGFEIRTICLFALGCAIGLIAFSRLLSWLLSRYHQLTLAVLTGFILGSLNKMWPWKYNLVEDGIVHEFNTLPANYQVINQADPQLQAVFIALVVGVATIFLINRVGNAGIKG